MLHLLHVLSDPAMGRLQRLIGEHRDNIETRLRQKIDADLARLCEHLAQTHGVTARCDVVTGTLLPSVLGPPTPVAPTCWFWARAVAPKLDGNLVVVGMQGETATEELLLGSVTKHVLQQSQSDVLVGV